MLIETPTYLMKLQITLTINPHCCLINSWCSCMNCSFGRHQQPQGDLKVQCLWSYIEFNQFNKTIYMYAKNLKNWNLICKFRILKNIICIYAHTPPPLYVPENWGKIAVRVCMIRSKILTKWNPWLYSSKLNSLKSLWK